MLANSMIRKPETLPPKKVMILLEEKEQISSPPENPELLEIQNLCDRLAECHSQVCSMGFMKCSKHYRHELYSVLSQRHSSQPGIQTVSLSELLSRQYRTTENRLSRQERASLAVQVTTSLLRLYSTPWILPGWDKGDIIVQRQAAVSVSPPRVYLRRQFPKCTSLPLASATAATDTQAIIFRLGVVLLELCIGEALEDQDLIYRNAQMNYVTEFDTAINWWQRKAKGEGGEQVAEAIRRCLCFDFSSESKTLRDDELQKAVYNEVVQPLTMVLCVFGS
jgi:hypothetical protein